MSDDAVRCGEWVSTPEGRVRRCTGSSETPSPVELISPVPVNEPPGIERQMKGGIAKEKVDTVSRRLVESALGTEQEATG